MACAYLTGSINCSLQVIQHAYIHVYKLLNKSPPTNDYVDNWWGEFSVSYHTSHTANAYINVACGLSDAPERYHDLSINAREEKVKHRGEYLPLDASEEHQLTLHALIEFTQNYKDAELRRQRFQREQELAAL